LKLNLPNWLTLLRIFLVPVLVVVLLTKFDLREVIGLAIFWIAGITDFFDGWIARRRGQVTTLGTLLDPIADKLLISSAFISLVQLGLAPAWMVVVIVGREFAVSGLRAIAADQGLTIPASPLGKLKTFSQFVAISLLIIRFRYGWLELTSKVALWIVVVIALFSGVDYFRRFLKRLLEHPPEAAARPHPPAPSPAGEGVAGGRG
jgi:CDP-diacylglycerol---glycerol-3-phosphate 3-phosphatidyltransferase